MSKILLSSNVSQDGQNPMDIQLKVIYKLFTHRGAHSSGLLLSIYLLFFADVSGRPVGLICRGKATKEERRKQVDVGLYRGRRGR
jgi:hypothetical protein